MRENSTITADIVTAALSPVRKLDARVWIRDERMLFSEHSRGWLGDAALAGGYESCNASITGDRVYRVATKIVSGDWRIYTQRLSDPANMDWPTWTLRDPIMTPSTSAGIIGTWEGGVRKARIWGRNSSGYVTTWIVSSSEWTEVATTLNFSSDYRVSFAPVSETECYALVTDQRSASAVSYIWYIKLNADRSLNSSWDWKGDIHSTAADWKSLSATRVNGCDYCYFSVDSGKRSMYVKTTTSGEGFSNPQDIFPLDYADDILSFQIGGVYTLLGNTWLTGTLTRSSSTQPMQIYTIGPDQLTAGRDMFIGDFGTEEVTRNISGTDYTFSPGIGAPFAYGYHIYYCIPGTVIRALYPYWLYPYASNQMPDWTYTCNKITTNFDRNGNGTLSVEVPVSIDAAIAPGMTLVLQPYIHNGTVGGWFDLGTYEIDAIIEPRTAAGTTKTIICRPRAIKRLSQWKSDASYDYWSQATRVSDLYDQRYNVRISNFKSTDDNKLVVRDLDKNALLYTADRTSTGYAARIKFQIVSGKFTYVGPMVSVHAETRIDAAYRLGVAPEAVNSAAVRTSGITLMYHNDTRDSAVPGWRLYHTKSDLDWSTSGIANCPWTILVNQVDQTLADGTYEIMLTYNHGRVDSYYRNVTSDIWTRPIPVFRFDITESDEFVAPYSRSDGRARAGMFARSDLDYSIRTRILRHGYSHYGHASALFEDPATIEDESVVEFEEPFTYNGATISTLTSRSGNFSTQLVSPANPIVTSTSGIIYADVYPWQQVWYPNYSQPWNNTQKATIQAEDTGSNTRWILLGLDYSNIDGDYRETYPNLDYANSGLGIHALDGAIIEFYNSTRYDGCAGVIDMVDWLPPRRWVPLWPNNPYGTPWTLSYFNSTGCQWESYPNNSSWGYWEPYQNEYNVGVHERIVGGSTVRTPENLWGMYGMIRVRVHESFYDYLGAYKRAAEIHFRPGGVNTNQTKARIYLPNRIVAHTVAQAGWAHAQRAPLMANKWVRRITTDTPVGEKIIIGSADPDRTFSWMAKEICRKAGVLNVSYETELTSFTKAGVAWDFNPDQTTLRLRPKAGIVRFLQKTADCGVFAVTSGGAVLGGEFWNGTIITSSTTYVKKWSVVEGTVTLLESIPMSERQSGEDAWVQISINNDKASVWVNDAIVAVFEITTTTNALMMTSRDTVTTTVDWPVLDMRVDNFVLDMNQPGIDLLRRLIKRKRVRFCDDSTGGIKVFRNGDDINTEETAYSMVLSSTITNTDANRVTRVRLEGIDVYEVMDETNILQYGNVFADENFDEFEIHEQFVEEGALYLEDADRSTRPRSYVGPADPRVEPWDKIWIDDGSGAKQIMVNAVTFNLLISEDQAAFDMQIDGEEI